MHVPSLAFFSLVLTILLLQIDQKHAGNMARNGIKKYAKNDAVRTDSNGPNTAVDLVEDLKNWDSPFSTDENIKTETKFRTNRGKLKQNFLRKFWDDSTQLKVQKLELIQFRKTSAVTGSKGIEEKRRRKRHPRSTRKGRISRDLEAGFPSSNGPTNSRCTRDTNFTLFCHGKLSCENRCRHPRTVLYQAELSCFCDEDCSVFQDCCADYDDFCGANQQNTTHRYNATSGPYTTKHTTPVENLVNQQNRDLWRCYKGEDMKGTKGLWMIGSCPSIWPKDDVSYRCRSLSQTNNITIDNYRYLPVYTSTGRVYHNRFCAQCNGVSSKGLSSFTLSIECNFSPPNHLSLEGKMHYLFQYCPGRIKWKRNGGQPRRYCIDFTEIEDNNSSNLENKVKCTKGKPRVVSTAEKIYKNVDCAKYIGETQCVLCGPNISKSNDTENAAGSGEIPIKPLSLLFDFNPAIRSLNIQTHCEKDQVYDHYLEMCRTGVSPGLPANTSYANQYQVVLWLQPPKGSSSLSRLLALYLITKTLGVSHQRVKNYSVEDFKEPMIRNKLQFTLEITQNEISQSSIKRILDFTSPFNISIVGKVFLVIKATSRILSCVNRLKYDRSEYTVLQDGSSAVSIKTTGEVFRPTEYYINTTEASANDSQAIFVCRQPHQMSNCSGVYILMNEGEFRVLVNKSIFVNVSKQVYDWSEYIWVNKSLLVCENFSTANDDPLLIVITLVCMSLSIICLVFVLVTYSLFSELRTPPGINLMNLSVSILLQQLLWLLGSGQTDTPMACTVIAVILHYLFLVSFMWTSIIAFDTWRAFSAKGRRSLADSKAQKMKHCLRHMAVGWLPAMAYVAICVALDLTNTVNIKYMSKKGCWMGDKWAILYFFAFPIGLILILNTIFFFKTYKAIKVTTAQARAASDRNTKKFGVYVRIASLMGFTWALGFVAPFGWQFLWYPFVILNGLQGVYIGLAFSLSKRARSLYKELLAGKSESQNTTVKSSVSRTKAQDAGSKKRSDTKL